MSRTTRNRYRERRSVLPAYSTSTNNSGAAARCRNISWAAPLTAVIITLLVFARTIGFSFVEWDDDKHILKNPWMYPTPDISHFWSQPYEHLYVPVSYTFWAFLTGMALTSAPVTIPGYQHTITLNPAVYHGATLALHLLNVFLVFLLLRRFVRNDLACAAGATLFGIHPLQVESVAWISETRGTLSMMFALLATLAYFHADDTIGDERAETAVFRLKASDRRGVSPSKNSSRRYLWLIVATLLFTTALLCKPNVVIVPVLLFLLDFLLLKKHWMRPAPVLAGWLAIAAVIVVETQTAQPMPSQLRITESHAPITASDALGFYFAKLLVPIRLGPDYGRTPMWLMHQNWGSLTLLIPVAIIAVTAVAWKRQPFAAAALLVFVASLLPVLGIVPFTYQMYSTVADRYAYVAMLGPALLLAWLLSWRPSNIAFATAGLWLVILAALSYMQTGIWRNSYTLFKHALAVNPRSYVAYCNLGTAFAYDGKPVQAIAAFQHSIAIEPTYDVSYRNLGTLYRKLGRNADAIPVYLNAISLNPNDAKTHNSLGAAYGMRNEIQQAREQFQAAVRLDPNMEQAYRNLALADAKLGDWQETADDAGKTLALNPNDTNAQNLLHQAQANLSRQPASAVAAPADNPLGALGTTLPVIPGSNGNVLSH